jgi:hypothetical protein
LSSKIKDILAASMGLLAIAGLPTELGAQTLMRFPVQAPVFAVDSGEGRGSVLRTVAFGERDHAHSGWIFPSAVTGFRCDPIGRTFGVEGDGGAWVETLDGNESELSGADFELMNERLLEAMSTPDLSACFVSGGDRGHFEFTIVFPEAVTDNDAAEDDQGEIVFFERGAGGANSWLKLEVVDEQGRRIGRSVVTDPIGKVATQPPAYVGGEQRMDGVTIDLSLFGVSEMQRLRVSRAYPGRDGMPTRDAGGAPHDRFGFRLRLRGSR